MTLAAKTGLHTPINIGVDWLTCTTLSKASSRKMQALGEECLVVQQRRGNDLKGWGMSGFEGFKCGQIQMGVRGRECIVRLTGDYADSHWRRFYALSENVSRLDLQVTVDTGSIASKHVARYYGQAARARRKNRNFPKVWECRDSDGPATLYFGTRVSDLFGRVYDKFSQAGPAWPTGAVRFELQCSRRQGVLNAKSLYEARDPQLWISDRVRSYFGNHALAPLWSTDPLTNYSCPRRRTDLERRLLWLQSAVRPSVQLLIEAGKEQLVLEALGFRRSRRGKVVQFSQAKTA